MAARLYVSSEGMKGCSASAQMCMQVAVQGNDKTQQGASSVSEVLFCGTRLSYLDFVLSCLAISQDVIGKDINQLGKVCSASTACSPSKHETCKRDGRIDSSLVSSLVQHQVTSCLKHTTLPVYQCHQGGDERFLPYLAACSVRRCTDTKFFQRFRSGRTCCGRCACVTNRATRVRATAVRCGVTAI